jgi:hypothetical protein
MNKRLLLIVLLGLINSAFAQNICVRTQSDLRKILSIPENRIAFENDGGLIGGGVCWWHSRLQRSSLYLAKYDPKKSQPTPVELKKILLSLRAMDRVVVIPGFSNFKAFSETYQKEIQSLLNEWQKIDGFLNSEWVRGISGRSSLPASEMKQQMLNVYTHYKQSPTPLWIMAQIKGLTSHSLLINQMMQTPNGFDLQVIDSNHPLETIEIFYRFGDQFLKASGEDYSFVPYVGFQKDFSKIQLALNKECRSLMGTLNLSELREGDIEVKEN